MGSPTDGKLNLVPLKHLSIRRGKKKVSIAGGDYVTTFRDLLRLEGKKEKKEGKAPAGGGGGGGRGAGPLLFPFPVGILTTFLGTRRDLGR